MAVHASTTLYFNGQFWCLLFEVADEGGYYAAQEVMGPEPSLAELAEWLKKNGSKLIEEAVQGTRIDSMEMRLGNKKINPKRAARIAAKETRRAKPSTASQEVLARQRDAAKKKDNSKNKEEKERRAQYVRSLRREKARERHKGH
ncbi:MAG: DUF2992 family protein [Propionibacteriaceae bacterium]|nr:DUF2992 family protein [Propionibacteriaceae bacterium]